MPLSEKPAIGSAFQHQPLTTGHFQTNVQPLDANGYSYSPGSVPSGGAPRPRKVNGENDDDERETTDPNGDGKVFPLGETPYVMMLILAITYIILTIRRRKKRVSA